MYPCALRGGGPDSGKSGPLASLRSEQGAGLAFGSVGDGWSPPETIAPLRRFAAIPLPVALKLNHPKDRFAYGGGAVFFVQNFNL